MSQYSGADDAGKNLTFVKNNVLVSVMFSNARKQATALRLCCIILLIPCPLENLLPFSSAHVKVILSFYFFFFLLSSFHLL